MTFLAASVGLSLAGFGPASAQSEINTVVVTAPGGAVDMDDARSISGNEIARTGAADLLGALTRNIAGVTLQDAQNNPWQPSLVYRGFVASPLQGQAQGLAAYMDGARFNQPFGDTVQFDVLPEVAIERISILDASAIYGLNALGGTIVVETKNGRTAPGVEANLAGGRFGYVEGSMQSGMEIGPYSAYVAIQGSRDGGWREFSPSTLYSAYADLGYDGSNGGVHLKLIGADSDLTGNGVSPAELLEADRRAVFTWPDNTKNSYGRASVHPWLTLSDETRLEGTLYVQRLKQRTLNGDAADIEACEENGNQGLLCLEAVGEDDDDADTGGDGDDEESILTDAAGNPIADTLGGEGYGVLNRGRTRSTSGGGLLQLVDERSLLAGENYLVLGFSFDWSRTRFDTSTELGALTEDRSVSGLGNLIVQADGTIAPVDVIAKTRYWGLFLSDRLPIAAGLSAELALRWNHAEIILEDQIGTALDGEHRFARLNPGIELDYEVSGNLRFHAGYAESNRAPTAAELSCADEDAPCSLTNFFVADPPLEQVVARSWELGARGGITEGALRVDWLLGVYRTANRNDIQRIASEIRGRGFFQNVGGTRRQGIEAGVHVRRGGYNARLSYAFTDATFRDPLVLSSPANPAANDDGTIAVSPGDRLPGIPRHSVTLSVDYEGRGWSAGGDLMARSGQHLVGDEANLTPKVPGYVVVNLRASIELAEGITAYTELRNALGEKYATFGTFSEIDEIEIAEVPNASDPRALGPGAPRRWVVGMKALF